MPLLNRSTRTKIVGALLATAALSVGAGALPATAAPRPNPSGPATTVFFHMTDGLKSVRVFDGQGGPGVCLSTVSDNATLTQAIPQFSTYSVEAYRYPDCGFTVRQNPVAYGTIDAQGSRTYFVHNWGFKKK